MTIHNVDIGLSGHEEAWELWCVDCKAESVFKFIHTPHSVLLMCDTCGAEGHEEAT